jgi:nucleolar protein 56
MGARSRAVVTRPSAVFLVDGETVVRSIPVPSDTDSLLDRIRLRRAGSLTPEEIELLASRGTEPWVSRDRRLVSSGIRLDPSAPASVPGLGEPPGSGALRDLLLTDADRALELAWDPSIHLQEAVRAASDLDRVRNLIGERLGSWVSRDRPEIDPGDHKRAAQSVLGDSPPGPWSPTDPGLAEARHLLAELYRAVDGAQSALNKAVERSSPTRTPNLSALLGPELAARLVAQAGGLDRLARMPASTVQVLGAERAFFEHLRGRASPPRHGLLFVHPAIQSAPRAQRGKIARALAGKTAIAARLDRAGSPLNESLGRAFESRRAAVRARPVGPRSSGRRRGSGPPLDRAARDR